MNFFQQGFLKEAQAHGVDPMSCWTLYKQAIEYTPTDYMQMVGGGAGLGGLATGLPTAGISAIHQLTQDKKKRDWSKPLKHGAMGAIPGAMLGGAGGLGLMGLMKGIGNSVEADNKLRQKIMQQEFAYLRNDDQPYQYSSEGIDSQNEHLLATPSLTTPQAPWNDPVASAQLGAANR